MERFPLAQKWKYLIAYILYFAVGYSLTGRFHLFQPVELPLTPIDEALGFMPWTVWIYMSEYLFFFVAVALVDRPSLMKRMVFSFFICFTLSFICFILYPTTYPRDFLLDSSIHSIALRYLWMADAPFNCFPSLHVATAFLVALSFLGEKNRTAFWMGTWAVAISISTITTRQHYFWDVLAGFLLAVTVVPLSHWLFEKLEARREARAIEQVPAS